MRLQARVRASEPALFACALVAGLVCAAMFLLQGRLGVNLQDEFAEVVTTAAACA